MMVKKYYFHNLSLKIYLFDAFRILLAMHCTSNELIGNNIYYIYLLYYISIDRLSPDCKYCILCFILKEEVLILTAQVLVFSKKVRFFFETTWAF